MKGSRYTPELIAFALMQAETDFFDCLSNVPVMLPLAERCWTRKLSEIREIGKFSGN